MHRFRSGNPSRVPGDLYREAAQAGTIGDGEGKMLFPAPGMVGPLLVEAKFAGVLDLVPGETALRPGCDSGYRE
jgi:hypothetical protein